jgi:hypothetical protein
MMEDRKMEDRKMADRKMKTCYLIPENQSKILSDLLYIAIYLADEICGTCKPFGTPYARKKVKVEHLSKQVSCKANQMRLHGSMRLAKRHIRPNVGRDRPSLSSKLGTACIDPVSWHEVFYSLQICGREPEARTTPGS